MAGLALAGCPGSGKGVGIEVDPKSGLDGPDIVEKRAYAAVLDDALCPCETPQTLRACLADDGDPCPAARAAAGMVRRLVSVGEPREDIVKALAERFNGDKVDLTLDPMACKGPKAAPVTVVEFADFECPHCRLLHETWGAVFKRNKGSFRLCFKHFPLSVHPNAEIAASAATAAGRGGKFWEMHDLIFANLESLSLDKLLDLANSLGFDRTEFFESMSEDATKARVTADRNDGELAGVRSTPTVFINGTRFIERRSVDAISAWIEDAVADAKARR